VTLYVTPVIYTYLDGLQRRFRLRRPALRRALSPGAPPAKPDIA